MRVQIGSEVPALLWPGGPASAPSRFPRNAGFSGRRKLLVKQGRGRLTPGLGWGAERALLLFGTALGAGLTAAAPADAAGFYLQEQSVRGWGRANSGEVADRGPDSLWWNPAAIGGDTRASIA